MKQVLFSLLIIVLIIFYSFSKSSIFRDRFYCSKQDLNDIFTKIDDSESIIAYFTETPLFQQILDGKITNFLHMLHVGIVFQKESPIHKMNNYQFIHDNNTFTFTNEYTAKQFSNVFSPKVNLTNHNSPISFDDSAFNRAYIGIEPGKFQGIDWSKLQPVLKLNGKIFKQFQCWTPKYNETNSFYRLIPFISRDQIYDKFLKKPNFIKFLSKSISIVKNFVKEDKILTESIAKKIIEKEFKTFINKDAVYHPYIKSSTCIDFGWKSLDVLYQLGAQILNFNNGLDSSHVDRTVMGLVANSKHYPKKMDIINNVQDLNEVLKQFQILNTIATKEWKTTQGKIDLKKILIELSSLLSGSFITHFQPGNQFFQVKLEDPYVYFDYGKVQIVENFDQRNPESIPLQNVQQDHPMYEYCQRF